MQVRLLVSRAGAAFAQNRGEVVEVSDAEGARMVAAGQAVAVDAGPRAAPVERAVKRGAKAEKAVR